MLPTLDVYISAARIASSDETGEESESPIQPGRKAICNAHTKLIIDKDRCSIKVAIAKLDSCGSVSIAHTNLLNDIQPAHKNKLPKIKLRGIGGRTNLLDKVGILKIKQPDNKHCKLMCYVFDEEVGQTKEMLLISLAVIINILYHMNESNKNECHALKFWPNNEHFEEVCKEVTVDEKINQVFRAEARINPRDLYLSNDNFEEVEKHQLVNLLINHIETRITVLEEAYMTEIQLRRILDRTGNDMEMKG
jgi:hypothetical protein